MIGQVLGHYRVEEKLGAGAMGEVYRATDEHLHRDVAIKVLPKGALGDEEARKRFRKEALTLSKLNHPNVAHIYDFDTQEDTDFLVMEYVPGRSLARKLEDGPLPESDVLRIGAQVAEALSEAHTHGIIHRDLKPANIALDNKGNAKVLDFGIAKLLHAPEELSQAPTIDALTKTAGMAGTLPYMAPEQLSGKPADERSDIHSLGVVMYEMTAGQHPFSGSNPATLIRNILEATPTPLTQLSKETEDTSENLDLLIRRCLEKNPADRFQSAAEARKAMHLVQTSAEDARTFLLSQHPATKSTRRALSSKLGVTAGIIVTAVVIAVAANLGGLRDIIFGGGAPGAITSIAILPLENLTGDPDQAYLVEGMHQQMITELSKISALKVIARTSVQRYRDTDLTLTQIAAELDVDAIIEGSVFRDGDIVRVNVQLIRASTAETLWADRFDRDMQDILNLTSALALAVVGRIQVALTPEEETRLTAERPVDSEAFEAYLKGRFHWQKQTSEDFDIAERYFHLALEKDPNYALAYAGLGSVWIMRGDAGFQAPSEAFPKGTAFLEKAMELDDSSAQAHVYLANYKNAVEWDWAGAERAFQRALVLNPNLADARFFYADMLVVLKRNEEWAREIERARELDPLNEFKKSYYGWHLNYLGRYDEAIPIFYRLLPTAPNKGANYLGLWGAYYKKGMYDEALAAARNYFTAIGEHDFAHALREESGESAYRAAMKRVGELMATQSERRHVPAIRIARMFAHSGDNDSAIQWLEKAYQARESPLIRLAVFWDWDNLRSDSRFQDLLLRMNLPSSASD